MRDIGIQTCQRLYNGYIKLFSKLSMHAAFSYDNASCALSLKVSYYHFYEKMIKTFLGKIILPIKMPNRDGNKLIFLASGIASIFV